ncbi:MAG: hypothetical protein ACI4DS_02180, partial [Eubacterium sp.]
NSGYKLATIYVDGTAIEGTTFTMPEAAVTVTATFVPINYNVTVGTVNNGSVSVDRETATVEDTVTVTATPDTGYELNTVYVNGTAIEGTTFTVPAADAEVTATFTAIDYTVTVGASTNGTISVDKSVANIGDTITVTATPDTGYKLDKVYVDGTAIEGTTFTMPAAAVEVTATFEKEVYNLFVNNSSTYSVAGATVSIKVNGTQATTASYGDTVAVSITPDTNYEISTFTAKSMKAGSTNLSTTKSTSGKTVTYTFTMPAYQTNVSVAMKSYNEFTFYYYYTGTASPITIGFAEQHTELGSYYATYWGKYCYKMTSAGDGWWKITIREDWGEFVVVVNPQNESETNCYDKDTGTGDLTGTNWKVTVSSTSALFKSIASLGSGSSHVVWFYKGRVFSTKAAALAAGNTTEGWTYYIAGGSTDWQNVDKGIFSNYWSTNYKYDTSTKSYVSTGEAWKDVLTKSSTGVYYVNLGKATKGQAYEFNIYSEKLWDNKVFPSNAKFVAVASGYVKIIVNVASKTYSVKYYSDSACTKQIQIAATTLRAKALSVKTTSNLGKVKLSWSARTGATKYYVYMYSSKTKKWTRIKTTESTSYTYKKLVAGRTYKFKVVAADAQSRLANSNDSNILTVKTAKNIVKSKAVAKRYNSGKVSITWRRVTGASGYIVYKYNSSKKKWTKVKVIANKTSAKKFTYVNKKASSQKTYKYKVVTYRNVKINGKKVKVLSKKGKTFTFKKK